MSGGSFSPMIILCLALLCVFLAPTSGYRILAPNGSTIIGEYFRPFDKGFVGNYGDPSTLQRERINEGAGETPTKELLYEDVSPRQTCPGMVGPFTDGSYYCTAREYGYCDRRSGACFCNVGYQGIDCSECKSTNFMVNGTCYPGIAALHYALRGDSYTTLLTARPPSLCQSLPNKLERVCGVGVQQDI